MLNIIEVSTVNETEAYEAINAALLAAEFEFKNEVRTEHKESLLNDDYEYEDHQKAKNLIEENLILLMGEVAAKYGFFNFSIFDGCEQSWSIVCDHAEFGKTFIIINDQIEYDFSF